MINFFVTRAHAYTIGPFLNLWCNPAKDLIRVVPYDRLCAIRSIRSGLFAFSDIDRLTEVERCNAAALCDLIASTFGAASILNHPRGLMLRRELLRSLSACSSNSFQVFDIDCDPAVLRYPVFIRVPDDHRGPIGGLIRSESEFRTTRAHLQATLRHWRRLVVVEYCDTRDSQGYFWKYSAFCIGKRIVPAHLIRSQDWVTKNSGPEPLRAEEQAYLAHNPHRAELMKIFSDASISYGRIDYGLQGSKIQVWEINTNPVIIQEPTQYSPDKLELKRRLVHELAQALIDLHSQTAMTEHEVKVPPGTIRNVRLVHQLRYGRWRHGPLRL